MEYLNSIDYPLIGGLLLLIGAILISEFGKIFLASILYLIADLCWIKIAYDNDGMTYSVFMIIIGAAFGLRTFLKMYNNIYHRDLNIGFNSFQDKDKFEISYKLENGNYFWKSGWFLNDEIFLTTTYETINLNEVTLISSAKYKGK